MSQHKSTYENLPLLSMLFVYALDRSTRYMARSFRSTALCRQFKGVTKGELVENSFQFVQKELIHFHGVRFSVVDFGFVGVASDSHGPTAISVTSTNIRVKNKIIKSRIRFETRSYVRDRCRRYLYSVRKYRRAGSHRCAALRD